MKGADCDLMFLADSPFKYKTFRRKEDARGFCAATTCIPLMQPGVRATVL